LDVSPAELNNYVIYQVGALKGFLSLYDLPLQHVKLHGALYNDLLTETEQFLSLAHQVNKAFGSIIFLTLATKNGSLLKEKARQEGLRVALEAFPDRQYTDEGHLAPRKHVGAVLDNPEQIAERAVAMVVNNGFESINGRWIDVEVDTLCIHGDNPTSIAAAKIMVDAFARNGIDIKPLGDIIP
jgi:UPF0271 protein